MLVDTPTMIAATLRLPLGYSAMLVHAFTRRGLLRREDVRAGLARQIHFTGVQALPYVCAVALLFGAVVVTQALALLGPDNEAVLKAVVWGGIRELGPLVTALIIIVRSSVAIAAEVALMRLRSGISDDLWRNAAHEEEVVLPRVLGVAVASAMLVAYFQFVALVAAMLTAAATQGSSIEAELELFLIGAAWWQVPFSIVKAAVFGVGIGAISCYHALHIPNDIAAVPKAVVAAGIGSLSFVIAVDLFAVLLLLA
jgi:phospholipid/cholesterol/gamma-HCH transport system permease protein